MATNVIWKQNAGKKHNEPYGKRRLRQIAVLLLEVAIEGAQEGLLAASILELSQSTNSEIGEGSLTR